MYLTPTGGSNAAALSGAKGACDAGTLQPLQIANGGYVCMIGGTPSGGAVYNGDNTIVAISGVGVDGVTPGETQSSLAVLMKSFVARWWCCRPIIGVWLVCGVVAPDDVMGNAGR